MHLFVGTSTQTGASRGIYSVPFDLRDGTFGDATLAAALPNPSFLVLAPDGRHLLSVSEFPPLAASFAVDDNGGLTPQSALAGPRGKPPSHIAVDRSVTMALLSHYHEGYVASLAIGPEASLAGEPASVFRHGGSGPHPTRQQRAHIHSAIFSPDSRFVFVCDLGSDRLYRYRTALPAASLLPDPPSVAADPGSGPRHASFSTDGRWLHVINELNSTVSTYAFDAASGGLALRGSVGTLPAGASDENICAEIRVHPNGRHVYGSNRGHDSIAVFEQSPTTGQLRPVGYVPSGGRHPRHFALTPGGNWLICANRDSDNLVSFRVDAATGLPVPTGHSCPVPQPVCVVCS